MELDVTRTATTCQHVLVYLILLELSSANFGLTRSSPNVMYNLTIQNTAAFRTIDCVSSVRCKDKQKKVYKMNSTFDATTSRLLSSNEPSQYLASHYLNAHR